MILQNFQYLFTKVVLVTDNEDIFKNVYQNYEGEWKDNCVYDEFGDFTVRQDFKEMKTYLYCSQNNGIIFDELLENIETLSNKKFAKGWREGDWNVLCKEYQISFDTKVDISFHSTDNGFFMLKDEDTGKIILQRTQYYNEEDKRKLYEAIAPVIVDVENIFTDDFKKSDNKLLEIDFKNTMDEIYHKEVRRLTEDMETE